MTDPILSWKCLIADSPNEQHLGCWIKSIYLALLKSGEWLVAQCIAEHWCHVSERWFILLAGTSTFLAIRSCYFCLRAASGLAWQVHILNKWEPFFKGGRKILIRSSLLASPLISILCLFSLTVTPPGSALLVPCLILTYILSSGLNRFHLVLTLHFVFILY